MQIITYNGNLYVFNETDYDIVALTDEMFISRCWFIAKNIHKYKNKVCYLETLANVWINVKYLGVSYDADIMQEISSCEV